MVNYYIKRTKEWLEAQDIRINLMNEIIDGIRILKYYAWEKVM
jgi:hypothetical protein